MAEDGISIGRVALTVHDLDGMRRFYETVIGLEPIEADADTVRLGIGERAFLELRRDPTARRSTAREAGLFHTAFLLPTRGDLGRWIRHAMEKDIAISGASDHRVSEALYLSDPEGNGIEIYADRPREDWTWRDGLVAMSTERLDVASVLAAAEGSDTWRGVPEGTVVGHVHLQVGALPEAEGFYAGLLGFDVTSRYPGGTFYAVDGYHHHLATNIWNSRGAGPRLSPSTGLADLEIRLPSAAVEAIAERAAASGRRGEGNLVLRDPWGTSITLAAAG